jgi:hypothetical protein
MSLNLYGENAFTFRFFNRIDGDKFALRKLLENLKRFDDPDSTFLKSVKPVLKKEAEIWLFPSFGKQWGFGEPDALLLVDGHALWFEVETTFELDESDKSKAIDSLRQLYRFHCAALAFARGPRRKKGRLVIEGPTITNENREKLGVLALRGHGAAAKLRGQLKLESKRKRRESHYVLLSVDQPSGGAKGFRKQLIASADKKFKLWDSKLHQTRPLALDHCWYTYWSGDLNRYFRKEDFLAGYVPIKKGS